MTTTAERLESEEENLFRHHFENLPVAFFGSVMGLTGLSLAWRLAHERFGTPEWIAAPSLLSRSWRSRAFQSAMASRFLLRLKRLPPSSNIRSRATSLERFSSVCFYCRS